MRLLIVLSGPVAVGKTAFSEQLQLLCGAVKVSTSKWMKEKKGVADEREALIKAGENLDKETDGYWVVEVVNDHIKENKNNEIILIDSVKIQKQIESLRRKFGKSVFHIHLTAENSTLESRYEKRSTQRKEFSIYEELKSNPTEYQVDTLAEKSELVLSTDKADARTLAVTALSYMGEWSEKKEPLVDIIVGGQYGSEGKGNICAHIANNYQVLMRIGGPNAGHLVADPAYKYVQLPSGTGNNKDASILIGAGSTLWLPQLMKEITDHNLSKERLSIDPQAMVIDDEDRRIESGPLDSIASTKQGVGSATARKILNRGTISIFGPAVKLARDVPQLASYIKDVRAELDKHFANNDRVLLEGTQGTLLSVHHGFWPHVTSRETSAAGCLSDAGIAPNMVKRVIMVLRTYPIRVGGTSGWMGRELEYEELSRRSGISLEELLRVEKGTISGTQRRLAEFDWSQLKRSAILNGATDIALTFTDYLGIENRKAQSFDELNDAAKNFIEKVEAVSVARVTLISKEFAKNSVLEREFNVD